jgi:hypothetical protein
LLTLVSSIADERQQYCRPTSATVWTASFFRIPARRDRNKLLRYAATALSLTLSFSPFHLYNLWLEIFNRNNTEKFGGMAEKCYLCNN